MRRFSLVRYLMGYGFNWAHFCRSNVNGTVVGFPPILTRDSSSCDAQAIIFPFLFYCHCADVLFRCRIAGSRPNDNWGRLVPEQICCRPILIKSLILAVICRDMLWYSVISPTTWQFWRHLSRRFRGYWKHATSIAWSLIFVWTQTNQIWCISAKRLSSQATWRWMIKSCAGQNHRRA